MCAEVQIQCLQHNGPRPHPKHHHPRSTFSIDHTHANGRLELEDPWLDPRKLVVDRDPIRPTDGSMLGLGSRRKELTPKGKNEAKKHHAMMATHPSLLANY